MFGAIALLLLKMADPAALATQGSEALDRGDYGKAEQIFLELSSSDPNDYAALFSLALAQAGLHKTDQAIENFKRTLIAKPDLDQAQMNLGLLYLRNGRAPDALPLLEAAAHARPDDAKVHVLLGEARQSTGDWKGSAPEFRQALEKDPKSARAELGLAEAFLHQGDLDQAKPHFDNAISLDPSLKSFRLEYAVALADAGRGAEAIPIFEQFPDNPGACEKLGQLLLAAKQPDKAVSAFENAVRISPSPANQLALATAYLRNNQPEKALPLLKIAQMAAPNDWELRMTVGRIYRDQKQYQEAADQFLAASQLRPDAAEAWSELAGVLTLLQQYQPALAALERLHALNAEKPGHYFLRAIILDKLHQLKPALASYRRFLETDGGRSPDQEFQARGRMKALEHEVNGR